MNERPSMKERREKIQAKVEARLRPLTVPNVVTMIRMAMIPFFVLAVNERDFRLALLILVLAGLTDAMDGYLARSFNMESVIGAYLDPIADKLLLTTAYVVLTIDNGQTVVIPLWLTILALFRDFLIIIVALGLFVVEDIRKFPPTAWGKATTFMHVTTVSVVLLANVWPVPRIVPDACFYISFFLVLFSGFHYIYRAGRSLEEQNEAKEEQPDE